MPFCWVRGCRINNRTSKDKELPPNVPDIVGLRNMKLPDDVDLRQRWMSAGGHPNDKYTKNATFCSAHFSLDAFDLKVLVRYKKEGKQVPKMKILMPESVPTLNLPKQKDISASASNRNIKSQLKKLKLPHTPKDIEILKLDLLGPTTSLIKPSIMATKDYQRVEVSISGVSGNILIDDQQSSGTTTTLNSNDCEVEHDAGPLNDVGVVQAGCSEDQSGSLAGFASGSVLQNPPFLKAAAESASKVNLQNKKEPFIVTRLKKRLQERKSSPDNEPVRKVPKSVEYAAPKTVQVDVNLLEETIRRIDSLEQKNKEHEKLIRKFDKESKANQLEANRNKNEILKLKNTNKSLMEKLNGAFSKAQLSRLLLEKRARWSPEDFASAITLLALGRKSYKVFRSLKFVPLPCISALQKYAMQMPIVPGTQDPVIQFMEVRAKTKSARQRILHLVFDEAGVRKKRELDPMTDSVIGPNSYAQVVLAQDLYGNSRYPIFFDFDSPMTGLVLQELILKLKKAGYIVVSLTCDLGPGNRTLLKQLNVTPETPFFLENGTGRKIYVFADPPHLLKLGRNHFIDEGYDMDPKELDPTDIEYDEKLLEQASKIANRDCVDELIGLARTTELSTHSAVREHLDVLGPDRQEVRLAAQLMSSEVAEAIKSAASRGLIKSTNHEVTAYVLDLWDRFFGLMNVTQNLDYGFKNPPAHMRPFGEALQEQTEILRETAEVFEKMRLVGKKPNSQRLPFQNGVLMCCRALPQLHAALLDMFPGTNVSVFTHRLSQDTVENFFSSIRSMRGSNPHPTSLDFKYRMRSYILGKNPESCLLGVITNVKVAPSNDVITCPISKHPSAQIHPQTSQNNDEVSEPGFGNAEDGPELLEVSDSDWDPADEESESSDDDMEELPDVQVWEEEMRQLNVNTVEDILKHFDNEHVDMGLENLKSFASVLAYTLRDLYPEFHHSDRSAPDGSENEWLARALRKGRRFPTKKFVEVCQQLEEQFCNLHGRGFCTEERLTDLFVNHVQKTIDLPLKLLRAFSKKRILLRLKWLDSCEKEVKKVEKEKKKKDKELREISNRGRNFIHHVTS